MSIASFKVALSIKPAGGGEAKLVVPKVLHGQDFQFVIVKDGEEGIISLNAPTEVIKKVEKDQKCKKLTKKEMEKVINSYPQPCIKELYRPKAQIQEKDREGEIVNEPFEVDDKGERVIEKVQTVRSGFYLIDVPISS